MWDFTRFDTDGDGQVSKEEIAKIRADKVTALDANGDGLLSEEELVAAEMADAQARIEKRVAARIAMSDADGDGMLSAAELAVKPSLPLAMFDRVDADGDGVITQEEVNAMKETMQKRGFEGHHNKDRTHPERGADKADGPQ
ncbi:histidine kinase [Rhodobacteraceae bacterium]|nr:histidine kinase [Paracoccaceae bacterium]